MQKLPKTLTRSSSASRDRGKGFTDGIATHPNVRVVGQQTANFDQTERLQFHEHFIEVPRSALGTH